MQLMETLSKNRNMTEGIDRQQRCSRVFHLSSSSMGLTQIEEYDQTKETAARKYALPQKSSDAATIFQPDKLDKSRTIYKLQTNGFTCRIRHLVPLTFLAQLYY